MARKKKLQKMNIVWKILIIVLVAGGITTTAFGFFKKFDAPAQIPSQLAQLVPVAPRGNVVSIDRGPACGLYIMGGNTAFGGNGNQRFHDIWLIGSNGSWTNNGNAPWNGRSGLESVIYKNKLWVIGGIGGNIGGSTYTFRDVWSFDGINWIQHPDAPWPPRAHYTVTVYADKIWVMGGENIIDLNDVWSFDGINWLQYPDASWNGRFGHTATTFNNKLWVIGGSSDSGYKKDIWYFDGITWTRFDHNPNITGVQDAPWSPRWSHESTVLNNQLWIMGGYTMRQNNSDNDIWSFNGTAWTQHPDAPWNKRSQFVALTHENKIWVMGGQKNGGGYLNDVWSFNGITWNQHPNAPWIGRAWHTATSIPCSTDIKITKTVNNPYPLRGTNVEYSVTVKNTGTKLATNVRVSEPINNLTQYGFQYQSFSFQNGNGSTFVPSTGILNIPSLAPGQSVILKIIVKTPTNRCINPPNTASLIGLDQIDSNTTNNQATATVYLCPT